MSSLSLQSGLKASGSRSAREMLQKSKVANLSLSNQIKIARINGAYAKVGGARSRYGIPITEFVIDGKQLKRRFSGGEMKFMENDPFGSKLQAVVIRYVGFKCESKADGPGADEPYFTIGALSSNGSRVKQFGPYENVEDGTERSDIGVITDIDDFFSPPVVLAVQAMEHDEGSPEEAEQAVRKVFEDAEKVFDEAAGVFLGNPDGNHVMPEFMRDIFIGWAPEVIAQLAGMADDFVGEASRVYFDMAPVETEWKTKPIVGVHQGNKYNETITVDGGDEGKHTLFFMMWYRDGQIDIKI